jgi:hypothetical protein
MRRAVFFEVSSRKLTPGRWAVAAHFHGTPLVGEAYEKTSTRPFSRHLEHRRGSSLYGVAIDVDPASGSYYEPVNLKNLHLLAQDGLPASALNPQFHQQMVYAVVMTTIKNFERAIGRPGNVVRPVALEEIQG